MARRALHLLCLLVAVGLVASVQLQGERRRSVGDMAAGAAASEVTEWPELLGTEATWAKAQIEASHPGKTVILVRAGNMMTMDWRVDRVRVIYSVETGLVTSTPRVG